MIQLGHDASRVVSTLARPPAPDPSAADVSPSDLTTLSGLAAEGGYRKLVDLARNLLDAGVCDVRVIGFDLFGSVLEGGPAAVPAIFEVLVQALTARWAALRPIEKKPKITDASLAWLFRSIVDRIDFQQRLADTTWARWLDGSNADVVARADDRALRLRELVVELADAPRALQHLSDLIGRLEQHFNRLPVPEMDPPEFEEQDEVVVVDEDDEPEPPPEEPEPAVVAFPRVRLGEPPAVIESSPRIEELKRKIAVFQRLVERDNLQRAAIVADDLTGILHHLDPRLYLPRLLAPHYRRLAEHAEDLAPYLRAPEGAQSAFEQLYLVDVEEFVASSDHGSAAAEEVRRSRGAVATLPVSPELGGFIRKLRAFEILVERGDLPRAAIVAEDVQRTVEHFDPRSYLPTVLAPFFSVMAARTRDLAPHLRDTESPARKSLVELYRVDLDAFEAA